MPNTIKSLAVGASLNKGKFLSLILKFRLRSGDDLFSSWNREAVTKLLQAVTEYMGYLSQKEIPLNGDSVEPVIKKNSPQLSQQEIEYTPASSVVTEVSGHVGENNNMALTISFYKSETTSTLIVTPEYSEWIVGYVANTLNEFEESGEPIIPDGLAH